MKDSFVFYSKYETQFAALGESRGYKLLMAIFEYQKSGEYPGIDEVTDMAFLFIKDDLDKDRAKWEETCQKRSDAGKQGGRPPKASALPEKQKKQMLSEKAKEADSDCDCECDSEKNNPLTPLQGEPAELIDRS